MKKTIVLLTGVMAIALVYSFFGVKGQSGTDANESTDYIIIRWSPYGYSGRNSIQINSGGNKFENIEITKDQVKNVGATNMVIDLLNKYNKEGYTLISSSSSTIGESLTEINCILKKTN